MDCTGVDELLADAWGNELTDDRRVEFDAHLRVCVTCRRKFDKGAQAVAAMRSLQGPQNATAWRAGDHPLAQLRDARRHTWSKRPWSGAFRMAASLLIAFTSGYALHAALMLRDAATAVRSERAPGVISRDLPQTARESHPIEVDASHSDSGVTLRTALARAYGRRGSGSDLARCLMAMSGPGRR